MKNLVFILLILGTLMVAPNVLWLLYSTVRVTNEASVLVRDVALRTDTRSIPVGNVPPQASRLIFLPSDFGGATFSIEYKAKNAPVPQCQVYVESTKYHVEIVIDENYSVQCTTEILDFSSVFVWKLL